MSKIKVGIIGASGYAGVELIRLILSHPNAEISAISSVSFEGQSIQKIYPTLRGIYDGILGEEETVIQKSDVVFAAVPHGLSEHIAKKCSELGKKCVDLGADFRLDSEELYKEWYGKSFDEPLLHKEAVYGLPELFRDSIKTAEIIGNPGCYPTASALALAPIFKKYGALPVIIDAKSGVTGAGRGLSDTTHFPMCNEAFGPYKVADHRHIPEIEQTLSKISGGNVTITFVPHLLPVNRGILLTAYVDMPKNISLEELHQLYADFYKNEIFVRLLPIGENANLKNVRMSNYCDISIHIDNRAKRIIVVSAIDNMIKGAAGQAIQNMNLIFGLEETCGLMQAPPAF